jgi:hypothetical protein
MSGHFGDAWTRYKNTHNIVGHDIGYDDKNDNVLVIKFHNLKK